MSNRSFSAARFLLLVLVFTGNAGGTQLSAQSVIPYSGAIFGLWLTTNPAGVSMLQVVEESADSSSGGTGRLQEPFARVFRCSIEQSWSDQGSRYYSVITLSHLIEGATLSLTHYLLRLSQDGQTLEIERSSAKPFRSPATDPEDTGSVIYHRLHL